METTVPKFRYAGFWKRFHAYKIDLLIVTLLSWLTGHLVGDAFAAGGMEDLARELQAIQQLQQSGGTVPDEQLQHFGASLLDSILIGIAVSAIYNILFIAGKHSATPGKRYCGIKVIMEDGSRPTFMQSAVRHLCSGVTMATGGLGFLSITYSREKLALHDALAHTRVIFKEVV